MIRIAFFKCLSERSVVGAKRQPAQLQVGNVRKCLIAPFKNRFFFCKIRPKHLRNVLFGSFALF